jgi:hypothetical protein
VKTRREFQFLEIMSIKIISLGIKILIKLNRNYKIEKIKIKLNEKVKMQFNKN